MAKPSVLGRGLGALLSEIEEAYDNELPKKSGVEEISISSVRPNPFQPRKHFDPESLAQLSESIKSYGLLQPIVVKEDIDGYVLIAGERRLRASKLARLATIKAIIVTVSNDEMREHALIENIQRDELNVIDLAQAYQELIEIHELTHEQLSQTVHKSRAQITNTLRLLQLNEKGQKALVEGKISAGHAKVIIALEPQEQSLIIDSIIGQKLSVRDVEQMVKKIKCNDEMPLAQTEKAPELDFKKLHSLLGEMGLKSSNRGSKFTIDFDTNGQIATFLITLSA
ncbi:MAG: ParB/RepB/Spo0J family partition protein [Campylobacterales bacterium]|nr:ParB/RepB/Spo0J family partition protein [Campylobacterales bacterium]